MDAKPTDLLTELPDLIALPGHVPERPSYRRTPLEQVKAPEELPPYLLLGRLDPESFQSNDRGWSARWVGGDPDTFVEANVERKDRRLKLHQRWCGLDGGSSFMPGESFARAVQGLYMQFPALWDQEAKARLERNYWLKYLPEGSGQMSVAGMPDGGFKSIYVPLPVSQLRQCWDCLETMTRDRSLAVPFMARLDLRFSAVNYIIGKSPEWTVDPLGLFMLTFRTIGLTPIEWPKLETATDGTSAITVRRWLYVAHIGVPFAGLLAMVERLAQESFIRHRTVSDPHDGTDGIELDAFIGGPSLDLATKAVQWMDERGSRRVFYLMSETAEGKPTDEPTRIKRAMGQTADESKSMIERVERINAEQVVAIDTTLERRASEENPTPEEAPAGDPDTNIVADMGDHLLETAGAPMQSLSDKERRCVKQAREKHVQALQRQVEDLATRPDPLFAGPLAGFDGLQRQDTTRGRVIQMLLMPLSILVIGVLALGTPFAYLGHLLNRRKSREARQIEMGALRAKIAAMRNDLSLPGPIEPKTIGGLWSACAIGGMSLSDQEALQLLNEWVETLYGRATRDTLQLENRAAAIHRDRAETYARAAMNGIFVTHMSILAVLLREIEQELPPYGQVGER